MTVNPTTGEVVPAPSPLATKIAAVMGQVDRVAKRGRNDFHKYDYATESDILVAVRSGLAEAGVAIFPSVQAVDIKPITSDNGKTKLLTVVQMTFTLVDGASGDTLALGWYGIGEDSSDKGIYKGLTGALKYFLLKTFLIPTGDDPEKDAQTNGKKQAEAVAPAGYEDWRTDMAATADTGMEALTKAWAASKLEFRNYTPQITRDAWKKRAAEVDKKAKRGATRAA